ncbi:hypothetical protein HNR39_003631 [Glaciimonas immobilis]|uniref:Uncharacterized protein n=1 Tax=Glaciimonas immobilis TaxID=728004 RepID=A0A840RVZ8_9BURK|nr:hypothetical protein [Glaciimonas immobilis]
MSEGYDVQGIFSPCWLLGNLDLSKTFTYNTATISSHVTGEKPDRCNQIVVREGGQPLGSVRFYRRAPGQPEWNVRLRLPHFPFFWPSFDAEPAKVNLYRLELSCF